MNRSPGVPAILAAILLIGGAALPPAAASDGERWMRVDTEHYRIIYQDADRAAAMHIARIGPSVWERVTAFMDYRPEDSIPVVLYGDTARANGFFTPDPPHVALFVARPAAPWMGARSDDWLETVLIHELVHYLHLTRPIGLFGSASRVFGPLAAAGSALFLPGWAIEGIAVSAETRLTGGGRGRNPYFEMLAVAPVLEDELYTYDQAAVPAPWAPGGRIYSAGYLITDYLLEHYGPDAFLTVNRSFQRWPFFGMRRAIRRTLDTTAPALYAAMAADLDQRYAGRRRLPSGVAIVPEGPGDWHLVAVTDRGPVAYHRGPFDPGSLRRWSEERSAERWELLTPVTPLDAYSVAVSHDGNRVAVVSAGVRPARAGTGAYTSYGDLWLIDLPAPGTDEHPDAPRRITDGERLYHPTVDGTGETLIAVQRVGTGSRLVAIDPENGTMTTIADSSGRPAGAGVGAVRYAMPALSRDGRTLAASRHDGRRQSLAVFQRTGARWEERGTIDLPGTDVAEYRPMLSADGDVWFVGDAGGFLALYRSALPGDGPKPIHRVLDDPVAVLAGLPLDDRRVLYGTYRSDGYRIHIGNPSAAPAAGGATTETTPAAVPGSAAAAPRGDRPDLTGTRFRDWPRPVLWYPVASWSGGLDSPTELTTGAAIRASSILARHAITGTLTWDVPWGAPGVDLTYTWTPGATAFSLAARQDPGPAGLDRSIAAGISRTLWYENTPIGSRGLGARVDGSYGTRRWNDGHTTDEIELGAALRLVRSGYPARGMVFSGPGYDLQWSGAFRPPFLSRRESATVTATSATAHLGRRTGRLRVSPTIGLATDSGGAARNALPWTAPVFPPEGPGAIRAAELAGIARVALHLALPPLDAAWRGVALQTSGLSVYGSQAIDGNGRWDNNTVVGASYTADLRFNIVPLRLTAGAAVRLPHYPGGDPALQAYLRFGGIAAEAVRQGTPAEGPARRQPLRF